MERIGELAFHIGTNDFEARYRTKRIIKWGNLCKEA